VGGSANWHGGYFLHYLSHYDGEEMKKGNLSNLFFIFSLLALLISLYQFNDARLFDGLLSLLFFLVLLFGGLQNRKNKKDS